MGRMMKMSYQETIEQWNDFALLEPTLKEELKKMDKEEYLQQFNKNLTILKTDNSIIVNAENDEEKALIEDITFLTITRVKFEKHLWILLDKVASYKLHYVIITDKKEIPQSVILPYAEYKLLQECYDKQEAIELAPLIEERLSNIQADNSISHEEMIQRVDEKRAKQKAQSKGEKHHG